MRQAVGGRGRLRLQPDGIGLSLGQGPDLFRLRFGRPHNLGHQLLAAQFGLGGGHLGLLGQYVLLGFGLSQRPTPVGLWTTSSSSTVRPTDP